MATVMHTLADHPPHGWTASLLSSHAEGGIRKKWKAYRTARKEIDKVCSKNSDRPDVIHLHAAADWSWRRKVRLIRIAQHHDVPCIVHLHSGQFDDWLIDGGQKRQTHVRSVLEEKSVQGVVLSTAWNERLSAHWKWSTILFHLTNRATMQYGMKITCSSWVGLIP
jgi:glycosyltransferase involved in cell wall biosynthesis